MFDPLSDWTLKTFWGQIGKFESGLKITFIYCINVNFFSTIMGLR